MNYITYGKLLLILLSRSTNLKQIEWVPPAPPLYKKCQVRSQVFGFPLTHDDIQVWAENHNIRPESEAYVRYDAALKAICSRLPRNHRRMTIIHNPMATYLRSMCIVVGTNFNAKDMETTQDAELIKSLYDAIDMGNPPGWFYVSQG